MKYGKQLNGRSVPEWHGHNIQYEDLKEDIKALTSGDWSEQRYGELEQFFFDELNNVSLFVRSKTSEIEFRLRTCQHLVEQARGLDSETVGGSERMYQMHRELVKLTSDIQKLSRFVGAQYTGFRKLIKKYRRHAPPGVGRLTKFEATLEDPGSFAHSDFTSLVLELSLLYDIFRTGNYDALNGEAPRLSEYIKFDVDFLRINHSRAQKWWVHPDHLVEVQVLLLQHTVMFPGRAVEARTAVEFLDTPDLSYARMLKDGGQLRQLQTSKAAPVVLCAPTGGIRGVSAAELNERELKLVRDGNLQIEDVEGDSLGVDEKLALGWVLGRDARPQAAVSSLRLRFKAQDLYVSLDMNIVVGNGNITFPYAVLEVRSLEHDSALLAELQKSTLVYGVMDSFSLYAYALAMTRPADFSVRPVWLDTLSSGVDIRQPLKSSPPTTALANNTGTPDNSAPTKGITADGSVRSHIQPRHSRLHLRPLQSQQSHRDSGALLDNRMRYWNEFDDGDEGNDNTFSVIVDAAEESQRRAERAKRVSQPLWAICRRLRKSMRQWSGQQVASSDSEEDENSMTSSGSESTVVGAQYSPRIRPRDPEHQDSYRKDENHNDLALAFITGICLTMATALTIFYLVVFASEEVSLLGVEAKIVLFIGIICSILLGGAGLASQKIRAGRDWRSDVAVQAIFFAVLCFGVGGVALLLAPIGIHIDAFDRYSVLGI